MCAVPCYVAQKDNVSCGEPIRHGQEILRAATRTTFKLPHGCAVPLDGNGEVPSDWRGGAGKLCHRCGQPAKTLHTTKRDKVWTCSSNEFTRRCVEDLRRRAQRSRKGSRSRGWGHLPVKMYGLVSWPKDLHRRHAPSATGGVGRAATMGNEGCLSPRGSQATSTSVFSFKDPQGQATKL